MQSSSTSFRWQISAMLLYIVTVTNLAAEFDKNWQLVWSDEFNGEGLPNPQWWDFEEGYLRNNELQYYTKSRAQNCRQEDGTLIIEARHDNYEGNPVTSASLTSRRSASWTYGKFEVRAQLAAGRGTWPAIWMLGDSIDEVGWPHCGEIDIMEYVGYDPNRIHGTVHTAAYNHIQNTARGGNIDFEDLTNSMHVYSAEWDPDEIRFYADGKLYYTFHNDGAENDATWPFDRPQHLKLNLAIGGSWGGSQGIDETIYPATFLIDYVRVYQRPQQPPFKISLSSTGPGTLAIEPRKDTYQFGERVTLIADPEVGTRLGKWKNVQVDRRLRTTHIVDRSMTIEADFIDPSSLIQNSDFSDELNGWYQFTEPSATAAIEPDPLEKARISVTQAGSEDWHVQFGQAGFSLKKGNRYQLRFDAQSISGTPLVAAAVSQNTEPYTTYHSSSFDLAQAEQGYILSFTHDQPSDANTRVEFRAGTSVGAFTLDNVRLTDLDEDPLSPYETWKRKHGIRPIADSEDPDHDHRPHIVEYIRNSHPFEADPYKKLSTVSINKGQASINPNFEIEDLDHDISISLQQSADLSTWTETENPSLPFQRLRISAEPPIED